MTVDRESKLLTTNRRAFLSAPFHPWRSKVCELARSTFNHYADAQLSHTNGSLFETSLSPFLFLRFCEIRPPQVTTLMSQQTGYLHGYSSLLLYGSFSSSWNMFSSSVCTQDRGNISARICLTTNSWSFKRLAHYGWQLSLRLLDYERSQPC